MSIDAEPRLSPARPGTVRPGAPPPPTGAAELPRLPGRRDPRWIALGVVALCLGALLSYVVYARVADETTVVAVTRTVYRGETVSAGDLTTQRLRGGTLSGTVPAAQVESLVGRRAVYDLPAGGLVTQGSVADAALPADGRAAVGLKLPFGRAPTDLLLPASPIRLVALPAGAAGAAGAKDALAGKTYAARVIDQTAGADGTSILLNVDVDAQQAPTVALLGAQDRIAVVRDAGR